MFSRFYNIINLFCVNLFFLRIVSISLVFINKALLSGGTDEKLDAPLFVTWFQCVVTVGICLFLSLGAKIVPRFGTFPEMEFNLKVMIQVYCNV